MNPGENNVVGESGNVDDTRKCDSLYISQFTVQGDAMSPMSYVSDNTDTLEHIAMTLVDLPTELIFYICDFLDARFIVQILKSVCLKFKNLFARDSYWKTRTCKRWPKGYPVVKNTSFDWEEACIEREDQFKAWTNQEAYVEHMGINCGQFAPIDVVHLMENGSLLASGSRDTYLSLIDLRRWEIDNPDFQNKDMVLFMSDKVHKGWIWSMASQKNILATGSWDTYIKLWDLDAGCSEISKYKCKSAILGLHYEPNVLIAGMYDKRICLIDVRDGCFVKKKFHRQPVLCIAADDNYIIAGSEDKTISIYDRRGGALYKTIETDKFTMAMSYHDNQLWVGDKSGQIHLYDATHGKFHHIQNCDVGHARKITGIIHTTGALFSCSSDRTIKVLHPTVDPDIITTLDFHQADVAGLAYQNGVLASAGSDTNVGIWRLKQYR